MIASVGKKRSLVLLVLSLAVLAAAFLVAGRFRFRLDLSADGSQSISKLSKELYKEIPERVRLSYYLSPALEARYPGPRTIRDLLGEFEANSRGKISLSVLDPSADPGAAEGLGLEAQRMQVVEKNEQRLALVYSGIVVEYLDRTEVLPFVFDASTLEYDIIKAVRRAVSAKAQRAALLLGDADKSLDSDYRRLSQLLKAAGWQTEEVQRGQEIAPGVELLIVLGNSAMEARDVYRLDQFLASGGSVLLAAKGVDIAARDYLSAAPLRDKSLLNALAAYGVELKPALVLDRSNLTVPFQEAGPLGGGVIRYVRYPHWIVTRPEFASRDNPLSSRLSGLDLFWPSPLALTAKEGLEGEILIKTSPKAWLQTQSFAVRPEESTAFTGEADGTTGQYGLVASLTGVFPKAFASPPEPREGESPLPPPIAERRPARLLVVGSSDFATDLMTMTGSEFNADFMVQAADWLSSGEELANLRSRGGRDPRLGKIEDPLGRSVAILAAYIVNLLLVPGGFALYGLLRMRRRRKAGSEGRPEVSAAAEGGSAS